MTTISSTSKTHVLVGNKNTQNAAEVKMDPNPNQSQCEQDFQDQQDSSKKVQNQISKYIGVSWNKDCKCWQVNFQHNKKHYYGGLFDNEEHAATKVNLLCDKIEIKRKNSTTIIESDLIQKVKNQSSKYIGVCWHKEKKSWFARIIHNREKCYGGYFDNEEHAAMKVNLLCDKYGMERKNPMILIKPDKIQQVGNKTSIYAGVTWNKNHKCWKVQLTLQHNYKKQYFGGYFDNEEHAAMKVNLLCDKFEQERKNPMIAIKSNLIQRVLNRTSIYSGVAWIKKRKKWQAKMVHKGKYYYGGLFDNEEHAALKINLICDKIEIEHKNPEINKDAVKKKRKSKMSEYATENIVNEQVKIEEENILDGFKDECGNRFTESSGGKGCIATEFQNSNAKRKRKKNSMMNDDKQKNVEITTPNNDENEQLEKTKKLIQNYRIDYLHTFAQK